MANARQFMAERTASWAKSGGWTPEVNAYLKLGHKINFNFGTHVIDQNTRFLFDGKLLDQSSVYPSMFGCSSLMFSSAAWNMVLGNNFVYRNGVRWNSRINISSRQEIEIGEKVFVDGAEIHAFGSQIFSSQEKIDLHINDGLLSMCWHFAMYNGKDPVLDVYPCNDGGVACFKDINTGVVYNALEGSNVSYGVSAT